MFYQCQKKSLQILAVCVLLAAAESIQAQSLETLAVNHELPTIAKKNLRPFENSSERDSNQQELEKIRLEISTSPKDAVLYNNLGVIQTRLQNYKKAVTSLEKAIALQPDMSSAYNNLSIVYNYLERYDKAIENSQKAVDLNRLNLLYRRQLCRLNLIAANYPSAVACYETLAKLSSSDSLVQIEYAFALIHSKQLDKALIIAKETVEKFPEEPLIYNSLGMIFFHKKKYKKSVNAFFRAIELKTDFNEARYNLALAEMMTNNRDSAIKQYNLLKNSNSAYAERLYKFLYRDSIVYVNKK